MTADAIGGDRHGRIFDEVLKVAAGRGTRNMQERSIVAKAHEVMVLNELHGNMDTLLT